MSTWNAAFMRTACGRAKALLRWPMVMRSEPRHRHEHLDARHRLPPAAGTPASLGRRAGNRRCCIAAVVDIGDRYSGRALAGDDAAYHRFLRVAADHLNA